MKGRSKYLVERCLKGLLRLALKGFRVPGEGLRAWGFKGMKRSGFRGLGVKRFGV